MLSTMSCSMVWLCACRALASCITVWARGEIRLDVLDGLLARLRRQVGRDALAQRGDLRGRNWLPVGEAVKAANTAIDCNCERIADSLAWAPYCTVIAESIRAVDDERADARHRNCRCTRAPYWPTCPPPARSPSSTASRYTRNGGTGAVTGAAEAEGSDRACGRTRYRQARGVVGVNFDHAAVDGRGVEVPVMESIALSRSPTVAVVLI